jgi:hypothetical protein
MFLAEALNFEINQNESKILLSSLTWLWWFEFRLEPILPQLTQKLLTSSGVK